MSIDAFEGPTEARIIQGETELRITIEDAQEIRTALIDALRISELSDREKLIAFTEPLPAWIESDDRVMIGGWLLQFRNRELVATYRLSQNQNRAVGYAASVIKNGTEWLVTRIVPEKIQFRPGAGR